MRSFRRGERDRDRSKAAWVRKQQDELVAPLLATEEEQLAQGYRVVSEPSDEHPCREHPEFSPVRRLPTQPRQSAETCPFCYAERTKPKHDFREDPPLLVYRPHWESSYTSLRALAAIDRYREEQKQRPGFFAPGSNEEALALDIIDSKRADELDAERKKSGRGGQLVVQRIEHAELVEYRDVRRSIHDRPAIVRVAS